MIPDYTLVCGVDAKHLTQLKLTFPTWAKHKSSLLDVPMVVFYDYHQVQPHEIDIDHPRLIKIAWPPAPISYPGNPADKFSHPQRHRMLSGFVHVPALAVRTPYWLKLDTDVVATGIDNWIDEAWFDGNPEIVAHPWGFTKPPDQMQVLDLWVEQCSDELHLLRSKPALEMRHVPGRDRISHPRVISWCGFFNTTFTSMSAKWASDTCGPCRIPVPSQDGFMWYVATRLGMKIVRPRMKRRGWEHWSTERNIKMAVGKAMM